jgi:hypothetical protein
MPLLPLWAYVACSRVNFTFTFTAKQVLTPGNGTTTAGAVTSLVYETEGAHVGLITGYSATRKIHSSLTATKVAQSKWFINTGQPRGLGCARLWNASGRGFITAGDTDVLFLLSVQRP